MTVLKLQGRLGKFVLKVSSWGRRHSQCGKFPELRKNFQKVMESLRHNLCGSPCCPLFLSLHVHMDLSQPTPQAPESQTVSCVALFPPAAAGELVQGGWGQSLTFTAVTQQYIASVFLVINFSFAT